MSDEKNNEENEETAELNLSDDLIAVIRELVQLAILTGTNVVDHLRAVRAEVVEDSVYPTQQYVEAYNNQIEELTKKAEEMQSQMQSQQADDESLN